MFDLGGLTIILIFIFLIVIAMAIALKLLSMNEDQLIAKQSGPQTQAAEESNFVTSFLKPIYSDGLDELENAVDSIRNGLDYYEHEAYVNAGEEFIAASHSSDAAIRKFREVMSMVEDPGHEFAKKSLARIDECKRFGQAAKDLEGACDAMLEERAAEAQAAVAQVEQAKCGHPSGTTVYAALERKGHHRSVSDLEQKPEPNLPGPGAGPSEIMKHRLKTAEGKAKYKLRQQTVEPVFGIIKSVLGFRQFLLRGLEKVSLEWELVCLAYNLKRLHLMGAGLKMAARN
jgi:hypothetical protein